jgi:hypothetical protein
MFIKKNFPEKMVPKRSTTFKEEIDYIFLCLLETISILKQNYIKKISRKKYE